MIVLSLTEIYQSIITDAAEDNGGICSFTRKLQYLFINKMRTRPIVNLNVLKLHLHLSTAYYTATITIRAQQIMNDEQMDSQSKSFLL